MCVDLKSCEDVSVMAGKELRLAQWSHRALGTGVPRGLLTCHLSAGLTGGLLAIHVAGTNLLGL